MEDDDGSRPFSIEEMIDEEEKYDNAPQRVVLCGLSMLCLLKYLILGS
jgi:hypothetical protein